MNLKIIFSSTALNLFIWYFIDGFQIVFCMIKKMPAFLKMLNYCSWAALRHFHGLIDFIRHVSLMFIHIWPWVFWALPWSSGSMLDHRSLPLCSNPGMGISEGCFIFDFTSLSLEVAQPMLPTMCTKVAIKHQSSSPIIECSGSSVTDLQVVGLNSTHTCVCGIFA